MLAVVKGSGGVFKMYSKHCCQYDHEGGYSDRLLEFLLLLVYDSEAEVDFIPLAMIGVNVKNVGECLFSVIEGGISIIQQTDAIPNIWILSLTSAQPKTTVHL